MTPEEFRRYGRVVIDWVADYMENVEDYPVLSPVEPGEIRSRLPEHPPEHGERWDLIIKDVTDVILPGVTHWQSPNFFAFFPANVSGPSILGELVSAGLGVQGMLWATSPAATELETHVLDWLVEMLDLPEVFLSTSSGGGVIQDSASSATLCAVLAARERATMGATNRGGVDRKLTAYASSQAHSSVEKAVRIAGLGSDGLHPIAVDENFAMDPGVLERALEDDRRSGATPAIVIATAGTTSSMGFDPLRRIGEICRRHDVWLHVDAAMAGTAALCPELRGWQDGLELADSYCFNPHKWMLVNFDCDCFYVADRAALIGALSILPEYLRNPATEAGAVIDYRDWQIPLGRRFRALKLWFVIRHYGTEGLRKHVRAHVDLAREFTSWVEADANFELAAPPALNLVCFCHRAGDAATQRLHERLNATGKVYLTHTKLDDRYTLRMSIGQTRTERRHVEAAWELIRSLG